MTHGSSSIKQIKDTSIQLMRDNDYIFQSMRDRRILSLSRGAIYGFKGKGGVRSNSPVGGSQNPPISGFIEPTPPDPDFIVKFNFFELSSMWQEILLLPGGIPTSPVTTNGQPIGTIQGQSRSAILMSTGASTARPLLASNGLVFDNTNDQLTISGAPANFLKDLHGVSPVFGMRYKLRMNGSDGVAKTICQTGTGGTTGFGMFMNRTNTNRVTFQLCRGTSGTAMVNFVTARTITAADGECTVQVNVNGTGANACSIRIRNEAGVVTTETFTILSGVDSNASNQLSIGGALNGTFSHSFDIVSRVWTTQEMLDYEAATPTNTTANFTPIKQHEYDFDDVSTMFADSGGTTPITHGTPIVLINNKVTIPYANAPVRRATAVDPSTGLVWNDSLQNGKGGAIADGSGSRKLTFSDDVLREAGCSTTVFLVAKNSDVDFGSQWMNGGGTYGVMTGSGYSANGDGTGDPDQPYFLNHPTVAVTNPVLISRSNSCNIIAMRRFGTTIDLWSQTKQKVTTTGLTGATGWVIVGESSPNGVPNFHPEGNFHYALKYVGQISDEQIEAKIDELRAIYNVPDSVA